MTKKQAKAAKPEKSHAVGYGKPPEHSQFKPGKSGNPKGRPKGSKSFKSVLEAAFHQQVPIVMNGKSATVPVIKAVTMKLLAMAMAGNQGALKMVLELYEIAYPPANDNQPPSTGSSFELTPEELDVIKKSNLLKGLK